MEAARLARGLGLGYWCFCFFVVGFQLEAGGMKRNEKRAGQVCVCGGLVAVGAEGGKMDASNVWACAFASRELVNFYRSEL